MDKDKISKLVLEIKQDIGSVYSCTDDLFMHRVNYYLLLDVTEDKLYDYFIFSNGSKIKCQIPFVYAYSFEEKQIYSVTLLETLLHKFPDAIWKKIA